MGILQNIFGRKTKVQDTPTLVSDGTVNITAADTKAQQWTGTFDNRNIAFTGNLSNYDYDSILRDKQNNIYSLFELADYYVDKDPIIKGIIKGVYVPFSVSDWKLIGTNDATKEKYETYYKQVGLRDRMWSIFYQYYKYSNVYIYLQEDGSIITLPVHKVRVSNVMIDGEPVLEFNARSISSDMNTTGAAATKGFLDDDDIDIRLQGFPKEVAEAVKRGDEWVQLNPENTFVLQDIKEDWMRYSIPLISSALSALSKKAIIERYESAQLNMGIHSFVHVTYGDYKGDARTDILPDAEQLAAVSNIFVRAMTVSNAIAVTSPLAKVRVIEPKNNSIFQFDMYKEVNSELLSAGGISGIIVSGVSEDGSTFATAQVSMQTAALRIKQARDNFCELMNKINARLNGSAVTRSKESNIPKFTFPPVDLAGQQKFQDVCRQLWEKGVVSTTTMLDVHGYDVSQEVERKKKEESNGVREYLVVESTTGTAKPNERSDGDGKGATDEGGRPELSDDERNSDPAKSESGKAPKPSRDGKDSLD